MYHAAILIAVHLVNLCPKPLDLPRLVDCIAIVENNPSMGPGGVLGWTKAAWKEETNLDYGYASDYAVSRVVAQFRLAKFKIRLKEKGIEATPAMLADCWYKGFNGAKGTDYGQRVSNLYYDK